MLQVMRTTTSGPPPMDHHPEIPNGEHELCMSCEPWFYVAVFLECANSDLCTTTDIKWIINITKLSSQFGSRNHSMFSTRDFIGSEPHQVDPPPLHFAAFWANVTVSQSQALEAQRMRRMRGEFYRGRPAEGDEAIYNLIPRSYISHPIFTKRNGAIGREFPVSIGIIGTGGV